MKNIKILLSLMLLLAAGLTSCDNDYAQPPVTLPEGGVGTGAWDNPMTAYQALLGSVNENYTTPWVKGYIVGYINTNVSNSLSAATAEFNAVNAVQTNMLIAMDPNETNWENCATVQLPSGDVRNALNLSAHPENLGKLVCIQGTTGSKYCSAYGVRSVSAYNWGNMETGECVGIEPDPAFDLPAGSVQLAQLKFTGGMNGFTFDQGNPSTAGFETWKLDSKYGFVAKGGIANKDAIDTDAWAISSEFDLTNFKDVRLLVRSAANFFNDQATFNQYCRVCVREIGATDWTTVTLPVPPAGNSWKFSDSGYADLSAFAGKKIEVGFHYTSTPTLSGTWEIDSMTLHGVPANK